MKKQGLEFWRAEAQRLEAMATEANESAVNALQHSNEWREKFMDLQRQVSADIRNCPEYQRLAGECNSARAALVALQEWNDFVDEQVELQRRMIAHLMKRG